MRVMDRFRPAALALALMASVGGAHAEAPSQEKLLQLLEKLSSRLDSLEKRNAELEARLAGKAPMAAKQDDTLDARVTALESAPQARLAKALDGIEVEAAVVGVVQGVNADRHDETGVNWRGDLGVTLPGGTVGNSTGQFFVQLRAGQAEGPTELPPTFTGTVNTASFQQADVPSENTNAVIAQAWYQLDTPLGASGADVTQNLQVTIGKQDPFVFFDQNGIADNEVEKFMNNVFVHNPMLDSGGAIGADAYGFTPGLRVAYVNTASEASPWGVSAAVYGNGDGSTFGRSFTQPFYIGQVELGRRGGGRDGTYRLYAWHNGAYEGYDGSVDKNIGVGLSVDQQVTDALTLFGRYGHTLTGKVAFNRALTLGGEVAGEAWGRDGDGLGLAWGWLRSAKDFRRDSIGLADYGYRASGAEQVAELYYRYVVNENVSLTPDLQFIHRPGADPDADSVYAFAVRALYAF